MSSKLLIGAGLILLAFAAHAGPARERLEAFAAGLNGLDGLFEQTAYDDQDKLREKSSGSVALAAPRQFRWQTMQPYQQTIIADGDHVWIYDPDLEQASVRQQSLEEAQSPLTVLTDLNQLERNFSLSEGGERDGLQWLRLKSKAKEPEFEHCDLGFDAQGLMRMAFVDTLSNRTEIVFSQWRRNPTFAPDHFRFRVPPGVDIIGDVAPSAEVFPIDD